MDEKDKNFENQVALRTQIYTEEKQTNSSVNVALKVGIFLLLAVIVILLLVIINKNEEHAAEIPNTASVSSADVQESSYREESLSAEISETAEPSSDEVSETLSEVSEEESVNELPAEISEISTAEEEPSSPKMVIIDRVINRIQSDAEKTLKEKGFYVKVNQIYSDEVESGKVVSQSPAYFTLLEEGGTVTINVSKGSEKTESSAENSQSSENSKITENSQSSQNSSNEYDIPIINIVGRAENDAANILKSQGFKTQTVYMSSNNIRKGYVIEQSPSGGIKQKYGDLVTLYVSKGLEVTVSFDDGGGTSSVHTKVLEYGGKYGTLPAPQRENYDFLGWYTGVTTGQSVNQNTIVAQPYDHILYARWKAKPISGWILDKDVPSGARIAEVKWTYTLTQTISSELPVMGGWKQAGSYWKEVAKGTNYYADFQSGYNHNDKYYSQYNHTYLSHFNDGSQKREVTTKFHTYLYWHWCSNVISVPPENMPIASAYNADIYSPNGNFLGRALIWESFESKNAGTESSGKFEMKIQSRYSYWWNRTTVYVQTYTDYKKYYQYYKVEEKESRTPVTESDSVSNIKRYVKYYLP